MNKLPSTAQVNSQNIPNMNIVEHKYPKNYVNFLYYVYNETVNIRQTNARQQSEA